MSLLRSTSIIGAMTFISRALGFVRDMVIARVFGAGTGADAFFVAFRIPNLLRRLFAEGSFAQAFVPVLAEYKARRGEEAVRDLADHVTGALGGVLFLVTLAGVIAAPVLVLLFAPGFTGEAGKSDLTAAMLRVTFPYLLFISLTALAGALLNTYGRFAVPAITPVFLNVVMIGAALWLAPHLDEPVMALAIGVFVAGVAQLAFQIPFLYRMHLLPRPRFDRAHEGVRRILRLMLPSLFGSSVAQINLLLDALIASFLVTGSVSWLYYSDRLVEFPLGVFGVALATVILPRLAQHHAETSSGHYSHTLDWALRWVALLGVPATIGLVILAGPLLATFFYSGEFTARDVEMASRSLVGYSAGLPGFILVKVLASAFYARQDVRTPVRVALIALAANLVFNLILVFPLAHAGLALATSLASLLNAALLWRLLRKQGFYQPRPGWGRWGRCVGIAAVAMTLWLVFITGAWSGWLEMNGLNRVWRLTLAVAGGGAVYVSSLWLAGVRWRELRAE